MKHLDKHFEGLKGPQINTSRIKAYIKDRLDNGAANGTVNRELAALKRMLKLGYQDNKVARVPHIPMLEENNIRQGFFEHDEYLELLKALPSYLRPVVMFAYRTRWRKKEILTLTWDKVDLKERTVSLTPGDTKNKNSRLICLDDELHNLFRNQNMRRHKGCPFVFHHDGREIRDIRKTFKTACKKAGIEDKLFHDLRRTAVRNLTRSGVQEAVCMRITGHKTRSVFDRYNIVSQDDLMMAVKKQDAYLSGLS